MTDDELQSVKNFFTQRFDQDFDLDGTPDAILRAFVGSHDRSDRLRLADLIDVFAAERPTEAQLDEDLFEVLGCYLDPAGYGMTARQWLKHVASVLRSGRDS